VHRFFFSLLTVFAIHTGSPEIHNAEVSLQRPDLCSDGLKHFQLIAEGL
jgi:hypothetical protein